MGPRRWGLSLPGQGLPAACLVHFPVQQEFLSSAWSSGGFYGPATADKWRRKTSLWSPAQLSESDFRSVGRRLSCFNPLWEGPRGLILDPLSSLPCLPTIEASFLPLVSPTVTSAPPWGSAYPVPLQNCHRGPRSQFRLFSKASTYCEHTICQASCKRGSWEQDREHVPGTQTEMGLGTRLVCSSL